MIGCLYVWKADNNQPFTIAQKIVTGMPYRHNSWGVGDLYGNGTQWQLEAFLCVTTTPIEAKDCRVFKINAPDEVLHDLTAALAERYSGRVYGVLSLLNYLGRAVVSLFGGDGRKFCPIRFGDVCSALIYAGLQNLAFMQGWKDLAAKLNQWHRNCYHSGDTITICTAFPQYFTEVQP